MENYIFRAVYILYSNPMYCLNIFQVLPQDIDIIHPKLLVETMTHQ